MIRKLNVPTAILLVACLTLAPTAMAADGPSVGWFTQMFEIVKEWVFGGLDLFTVEETTREDGHLAPAMEFSCSPADGEAGPNVDPSGPGCGG